MGTEWLSVRLGDIVEVYDGPHATPKLTDAGPVFLGISNLSNGRLDLTSTRHLSDDDFQRWTRRVTPHAGDLLFSYETRLGEAALMPADLQACLGRRMGLLRPKAGKVDGRFLLYAFLAPAFQDMLRARTIHGSTVDRIPLKEMPDFRIELPNSLRVQQAIATVLGALDDKIELNRRMNETLEQMARAMFKAWFVDFDPVRAQAEGRDPIVPQPHADLFPDSFTASELGQTPTGWKVGPILEHARLISGGTPKTDRADYWGGSILWASAKDVSRSSETFLVDTERTITPRGLEESATQMIPAFSSVVVARGATTGRMVMFGRDMAMNQTCYALATTTETPFALYCRLRVAIDALVHAAHGSVFDTITTSTFASSRIVLPTHPALLAFEERVTPVFQRILGSIRESRTLSTLRDTLLPKLISGEIRIPDAERIVSEAT